MRRALAALALLAATPALAQGAAEERFCPNRPDLGSSGCTVEPGRVLVEVSGVDWQRTEDRDEREDQVMAGDTLVRLGIAAHAELQLEWSGFGHVRTRVKATGAVDVRDGAGDVRLGIRRNLIHSDGKALSVALEPFAVIPVGDAGIGDGDWSAGLVLPVSYELADKWDLNFTGTAAAQADDDGDGRHLQLIGIVGLGYDVSDKVTVVGELSVDREDDPRDPRTETLAAASVAWQPRERLQLDLLAVAGLSRASPDLRLVFGGAILF